MDLRSIGICSSISFALRQYFVLPGSHGGNFNFVYGRFFEIKQDLCCDQMIFGIKRGGLAVIFAIFQIEFYKRFKYHVAASLSLHEKGSLIVSSLLTGQKSLLLFSFSFTGPVSVVKTAEPTVSCFVSINCHKNTSFLFLKYYTKKKGRKTVHLWYCNIARRGHKVRRQVPFGIQKKTSLKTIKLPQ